MAATSGIRARFWISIRLVQSNDQRRRTGRSRKSRSCLSEYNCNESLERDLEMIPNVGKSCFEEYIVMLALVAFMLFSVQEP